MEVRQVKSSFRTAYLSTHTNETYLAHTCRVHTLMYTDPGQHTSFSQSCSPSEPTQQGELSLLPPGYSGQLNLTETYVFNFNSSPFPQMA